MSRIHQALKKAEAERQAMSSTPPSAPAAVREIHIPDRREPSPAKTVRPLPERDLPSLRFSPAGEAVLCRAYDGIERLCSEHLDSAVRANDHPLRVVLVAGEDAGVDAAPAALALAAAVVERSRLRAALVDLTSRTDAATRFFETPRGADRLPDARASGSPVRWLRRTPLEGLLFVPAGDLGAEEGTGGGIGIAAGVARLLESCHVVLLAADAPGDDGRGAGLAPLAGAAVIVTRERGGDPERLPHGWVGPGAPLYWIPELPAGDRLATA